MRSERRSIHKYVTDRVTNQRRSIEQKAEADNRLVAQLVRAHP